MPSSRAEVTTEAAARYAKQLASHLGRKAEVVAEAEGDRILIGEGSCLLLVGESALTLHAQGPSEESLSRVQDVVGRHLERFGARNELVVIWRSIGT
jgi:hypothetical protein